jgi:hypothetical protein
VALIVPMRPGVEVRALGIDLARAARFITTRPDA